MMRPPYALLLALVPACLVASASVVRPAWAQDDKALGQRLYDVTINGLPNHQAVPGRRANHIKGAVYEGEFTATPEAASLSVAPHFEGKPIPLTLRFSNVGGIPDVADNSPASSVRGMAMMFHLPDGTTTSLVGINMPFFIAKTPEDFIGLNVAGQTKVGPDVHPTPFQAWMASHPETGTFLGFPRPMPASFGTEEFYTLHAYKLTDASGTSHFVRFHIVPDAGPKFLTADEAAKTEPNVLFDEMKDRVAKGPVTFKLLAQIGEPGDVTNDPTVSWPDSRKVVTLGTISVAKADPDSATAEKALVFMPNQTAKGFDLSDDPFLNARAAVYAVGFDKRK